MTEHNSSDSLCRQATAWVLAAGDRIRREMDKPLAIYEKDGIRDLVTDMDIKTETFLTSQIRQSCPRDRIYGEESQSSGAEVEFSDLDGNVWILDPIDGTSNFIRQRRDFAVMLALYRDGQPVFGIVYDVMREECYVGVSGEGAYLNGRRLPKPEERDLQNSIVIIDGRLFRARDSLAFAMLERCMTMRAPGASALSAIMMARGGVGAYLTDKQMPWDAAAPNVILHELGFVITRPDGQEASLLKGEPYLVALPELHAEIRALAK